MIMGLGAFNGATVTRATLTPDGKGNNIKSWLPVYQNVNGRLASMSAREVEKHASLEVHMSHNVIFEGVFDIRNADHVTIPGSLGQLRVMLVQAIMPADQFMGRYTVAQCLEITGRSE